MGHIKKSLTNFTKNPIFRVMVEGESCWPKLIPGKTYFASGILKPKTGDFVVFKSGEDFLVKEIKKINNQNYIVGGTVSFAENREINKDSVIGKIRL